MRLLVFLFLLIMPFQASAGKAYDRLEKTNTIRCGFQYWDGGVIKNEVTGAFEGFIVDLTNELAKLGGFDVEWVGPIDWGQVKAELASGKIDMMCAGMWQAGQKARYMIFSNTFVYQGVQAYVREDESRFSQDYEGLNSAGVKAIVVDADNSFFIAESQFPKADRFSMPLGASDSDMLQALINKKGDVAFTAPGLAYQFELANTDDCSSCIIQKRHIFLYIYYVNMT